MTPTERISTVLAGRLPDRPPFSFWHHFPADQVSGSAAVEAHLDHLETYQLDFLKVMNDNPYPHASPVASVADLAAIRELRGDEDGLGRQLELLSALRARLNGRVPMVTTIFNAWATLRHLIQPPHEHNPPVLDATDQPSQRIRHFLDADPDATLGVLGRIARSLANFAGRCLAAGADGIFLSVRDDWVDSPGRSGEYARWVRPGDLTILSAASAGTLNILHVCGRPVDLRAFNDYPVHVVNWADREGGPSIAQARDWLKPAICAGVDNLSTLPDGTAQDVEDEVRDAVRQAGGRPIFVAPGCTYDPNGVPRANLDALARAVREFRYH